MKGFMKPVFYRIRNKQNPEQYWSNAHEWVDIEEEYTLYTDRDVKKTILPNHGVWERMN